MTSQTRRQCLLALLVASCSSRVDRTNPFDPEGTGPKEPGRIEGKVYVQGAATQLGVQLHVVDELGTQADSPVTTDAAGSFVTAKLPPGIYALSVEVPPDNSPIEVANIAVLPGQTTNVGLLTSTVLPPDGVLTGQVVFEDTVELPSNVRVVATRVSQGLPQAFVQYTDSSGNFAFAQLPAGDYEIISDRSGFTPDRALASIAAPDRSLATLSAPLRMYPASAVVRFSVRQRDGSQVIGAPYTNHTDVDLLLLAFGGVNEMRFSEAADFIEGGTEVAWRDHLAQVQLDLSAGEGAKTMYAQFRVMDGAIERLRTETYAARVVLDTTPPQLVSFVVDPAAVVTEEHRYLSAPAGAVPVQLTALDGLSNVAGVRLVLGSTSPSSVAYDVLSATGPSLYYTSLVSLVPAGDGDKLVRVQLMDGAGNESALVDSTVTVDTTPPALLVGLGEPAIVPVQKVGSFLTSLTPTLQLLVGGADGPTRMRYGTSQANLGPWVAFQPQVGMTLGLAEGAPVQFFAEFKDAAGNSVSADSAPLTVRLTGRIRGLVQLEGLAAGSYGGTTVEVFAGDQDVATTPLETLNTLPTGAFLSSYLAAGTYKLRVVRVGYTEELRGSVTVSPALDADAGVLRLDLARGALAGVFQLSDLIAQAAPDHSGTQVEAVRAGAAIAVTITDADGSAAFANLPIGAYTLRASHDGYATTTVSVSVVANVVTEVASDPIVLGKLTGDFRVCDQDEPGPAAACTSILYTNEANVRLGFQVAPSGGDTLYVRYGVGAFLDPAARPGDVGADCGAVPSEQCWNEFDAADSYLVDVSGAEGRVELVAQFQLNSDPVQPEQRASVIYDVTAPLAASLSIARGAEALLDGFTKDTEVQLTLSALAAPDGTPDSDVAPLGAVYVSRGATWDEDDGSRQYTYSTSAKAFTLATTPGPATLRAWFCDKAGNCTGTCDVSVPESPVCSASTVDATIVLDTGAPSLATGATATPSGASVTVRSPGVWWTRSGSYDVAVGIGDSGYDTEGGDSIPEVVAYQLSLSGQFVGASWVAIPFTELAPATTSVQAPGIALPAVEADHVVHVRFKDAAGNVSLDAPFTLSLDETAPSGVITLASGAAYARDADAISVTLSAAGASFTQHVWDAPLPAPSSSKELYAPSHPTDWALPTAPVGSQDGSHVLRVRFFDDAGNYSEASASLQVDETPPEAGTAIAQCYSCTTGNGTRYFRDPGGNVTLFLFAADSGSGIASTRVQVDASTPVTYGYAPYTQVGVGAPGAHTLLVRFVDRAGNESSAPISLGVVRDETPPAVTSLVISGGATTATSSVQLAITATDGGSTSSIASMTVTNSAVSFAGATTLPFNTPQPWTLDGATDGTKTVRLKLVDYAGNESAVAADTIVLDRAAPTLVFSAQDATSGSSTLTNASTVHIALTATDCVSDCSGVSAVYLSNDGDFSTAVAKTYPLVPVTWDLCPLGCDDGLQTVYVRVVDGAGNTGTAQASIVLDSTEPILSGAELESATGSTEHTNSTAVTLKLAMTGADEVRLTGALLSPTPGAWLPAQAAYAIVLTPTSGDKELTVEARDAALNPSSPASLAVQIALDVDAPTAAALTIADNQSHTATRTVSLAMSASDGAGSGITQMSIVDGSSIDCATATYENYAPTMLWSLPVGDGSKSVSACFKDAAGNTASTSDSIVLDVTAPASLSLSVAGGATYVTSGTDVVVVARAADNLTVDAALRYQLATEATFAGVTTWLPFTDGGAGNPEIATTDIDLSGADGTKTLYLRVRDEAGNVSETSASVTLDSDGPIAASVLIDDGADYATTNTGRALALSAEDGVSGVAQMNITSFTGAGSCALGTWKSYATSDTINLGATAGEHTVCAWFKDNAGTVVGPVTDTIVVDLAGPSGLAISVGSYSGGCGGDAHWTSGLQQTVTLAASDDYGVSEFQVSIDPTFASATWTPWTGSLMTTTAVLSSTNGQQTLYLRVRDYAGRVAPAAGTVSVCLTLDTEPPEGLTLTSLDGAFTADDLTALELSAYDDGVGGTTGLAFLVTTDSSVAASGIDQVAGISTTTYSEGSWISWPDDGGLRARWDLVLPASKLIEVQARDPAGNVSERAVAFVEYDAGSPTLSAFSVAGGTSATCGTTYVSSPQIEARLAATDGAGETGPRSYKLAVQHPGCTGAQTLDEVYDAEDWVDEASLAALTTTVGLPCGDGDYQFKVGVRDAAGNNSNILTRCLTLDTVAPTLFSVSSAEGAYSSDSFTTVAVVAADERTATSELEVQVADGASAADPVQSDVRPVDGVDEVAGASATPYDVNEWFTWPDDDAFRVRWQGGDGPKRLHVRVRDLAGNESDAVELAGRVTIDSVPPTAPVITFVRSLNAGAELAWSASDAGTGTGIANYRIDFVTTDGMTPSDSGYKNVGTETQWILTGAEGREDQGLWNKRQYAFHVTAYDQAGNSAQTVTASTTAVGWTVTPVVTGSSRPLVPQDIAYNNGKIYVLFHELGVYTDSGSIQTAAAAKLAVSSDGGATWSFSVVTAGTEQSASSPARVRSQMSVGANGVAVVTVTKADSSTQLDLVEYSTADDGLTWSKQVVDSNIGYFQDSPVSLGMSKSGSSRVVLYSANNDPAPVFFGGTDFLVVRRAVSPDDVHDLEGGLTPKWWASLNTGSSSNVVHENPGAYYSVCNANFFDHATWSVPLPAQVSKDDTLQVGEVWTMVSPFHGRGRWMPSHPTKPGVRITGNNLAYLTLSCAALGDVAWFHYVGLKRDGAVTFLPRTNNHAYGEADGLAGNTVTTIVSAGGADVGSPVATWAGGNKVYVAYRRASDAALAVLIGANTPPAGPGSVTFEWRENVVDASGDAGRNPVMTGFATESPLIAYTDLQGSELKIARAAQLAPQTTPDARYDLARYTWADDGVADAYIVSVTSGATCSATGNSGPNCAGGSTCSYTPLTQYSYTSSASAPLNRCVETVALDEQGLPGDLGEKWQLAPFTELDLAAETWPTRVASSQMSSVAASGPIVAALRPTYNEVVVEISENSGATFPGSNRQTLYVGTAGACTPPASPVPPLPGVPPDCLTSKALAMTVDSSGADPTYYVHVFFQTRGNPGSEVLRYVRGSKTGAGAWNWSPAVTIATDAASIGQDLSVRAEASYVVATYRRGVATPSAPTAVFVRTSADHGASWISAGIPTGVPVGGPDGFKPVIGDLDTAGGPTRIYAYYFTKPAANPLLSTQKDILALRSVDGGGSFNAALTPTYRLCDGFPTFVGDKQQCGDPQILAAGRNAQYFIVASVDGQSTTGARVRLSVTSEDIGTADGTAGADGWSRFHLDVGSRVVIGRTLAMAATNAGAWLAYSTCDDLGVSTVWKLNLAYCQRDCHSAEAWKRMVVRNQTSSELACSGEWYNGLALAADAASNQLFITYTTDETGGSEYRPRTKLLRQGWVSRQR